MRYRVDEMTMADLPRIVEIERLAYTTPWPPSAYRRELQENRMAHYIVVRDTLLTPPEPVVAPKDDQRKPFPLSLLPVRIPPIISPEAANIVAFSGLWHMVNEAHITTIAVHPEYRGRGVGELMLSTMIDRGYAVHARYVTLEVRVSNYVAQNLYRKYGFSQTGVRRRYYSDNHEDAFVMSTENITSETYRERFAELKARLAERLEADNKPPLPTADAGS
ncbi:MAG TPA: ribosomal protein S18-alanine N-acetyltransferase [Ktedonobacterales bacterium]|nr:ribosomal protein S18-alanine N-acetyltransferase [Ktedonobacterales bacterium]